MKRQSSFSLLGASLALAMMLLAAGGAYALKPTEKLADRGSKVNLESMVPKQFGGWKVDTTVVPVQVSPDLQARLNQIYNQTLARTYIGPSGQRIMLSIAYGGDQSDSTQMHRPEVCYSAQGFQVSRVVRGLMSLASNQLPVVHLVAQQGTRVEPITYWMTVGDYAVRSTLEHKLAQLRYGLTGTVPDGLLVRVSSIGRNAEGAYEDQRVFVEALMSSLPSEDRRRLVGLLAHQE